jgi:hypothetical protein
VTDTHPFAVALRTHPLLLRDGDRVVDPPQLRRKRPRGRSLVLPAFLLLVALVLVLVEIRGRGQLVVRLRLLGRTLRRLGLDEPLEQQT